MTSNLQSPGPPPAKNMVWIPGGAFQMGSNDFYVEERPVRRVSVDGFWMDQYPVTVAEFRRFVKTTGYVTVAERPLDPADCITKPGSQRYRVHPLDATRHESSLRTGTIEMWRSHAC
jgi:formylglycine-generating enzyme required for sulfatase activity